MCEDAGYLNVTGDVPMTATRAGGAGRKAWIGVTVRETNFSDEYTLPASERAHPRVKITLESPPGADYDLYVECHWCLGNPSSAPIRNLTGHAEVVAARANDLAGQPPLGSGEDQTFDIVVEVRWVASATEECLPWNLTFETAYAGSVARTAYCN